MSGQTMSIKEKDRIIEEFINRENPYRPHESWDFDVRGFIRYIEEHNIPSDQIDESIVAMFER